MMDHRDPIDFTSLKPDVARATRRIMAEIDRSRGAEMYLRRVAAIAGISAVAAAMSFYVRRSEVPADYSLETILLNVASGQGSLDMAVLLDSEELD